MQELQQIQKVISDKNTYKYFQEVGQSTNKQQYLNNLQVLYKNVTPTLEVRKMINILNEKAEKMCFPMIKTDRFLGTSFKFSANRYMSILIRYLFTHNSTFAKSYLPKPRELYPSIKNFARQFIRNLLKT